MDDRPSPPAEITLRFLAAPTDAGHSGSVSAGRVLEWIDKAGYAAAAGWSGTYCVTAYVGNVRFTRPVEVGDLVEVTARVVHTGRSSMHISVDVASGGPRTRSLEPATRCLIVFVAVDGEGRSTPVPELVPRTTADDLARAWALRRADVRAEVEAAMAGQVYSDAGTAPRVTLRFLAAPTDVNWGGKVHGGIVMRWIDEAAHVLATQWTGSAGNVAIFTGGVRFYRPLRIGHLVEVEARLLHTGRTSMHVGVHVRSGDPAEGAGALELTTYCRTILVGLDADRHAVPTPTWEPVSAEDRALDAHAVELVAIRARHGD
ncbi:hotdog domain-containing protein [Arthrobacter sp. NEB 688]|uniref:acyl-CoA thioesterase n=1 Tax=Arthrobacter sp. NEB 688 TaxID=904039 RepID=UPI001566AEA5|nr:hotdog domain-containing protein [Arthrobacter sp. NEB 688]QKE84325.1 acyl-CoA thioesterase [Arthrobacter sp. NEB 688]